jgi:hypothetical protein
MPFEITKSIEQHKVEFIDEINRVTTDCILGKHPITKQLNLSAKMMRMQKENRLAVKEWEKADEVWSWIDSIVTQSNAASDLIKSATTVAEMRSVKSVFLIAVETL